MSDELRFYVRHIRGAKICMSAARGYFEKKGWSWDDFLTNGRPVSDLLSEDDVYALRVAEQAQQEAGDVN